MGTGPAPKRSRPLKFHFADSSEEGQKNGPARDNGAVGRVTSDDILESLQKRSGRTTSESINGEETYPTDSGSLDNNDDDYGEENFDGSSNTTQLTSLLRNGILRRSGSHHVRSFTVLVLGALAIVGVYESMTHYGDPFYFVRRISTYSGTTGLLGNSFYLIIISMIGIVALGWMMRHHRNTLANIHS